MNKPLKILITDVAQNDIKTITDFIAKDNRKAAVSVVEIYKETFKMLSNFPSSGVNKVGIKYPDVLIFTLKKRYSIVYRVNGDTLEILRVLTRYQDLFAIL